MKTHSALSGPFDATIQQIGALNDVQLVGLVRLLLEAEARRRSIPLSSIDVGGAHTAPDGGIDARIKWTSPPEFGGWLPAGDIVFQCKATEMPKAACVKEIKPGGNPRAFFSDLAMDGGAYILATTKDLGNATAAERITAMRAALSGLEGSERITLEIYAADRLARWANEHVGVAMWVREQSGLPLGGWRPYEPWSNGDGQPYIIDERARALIGASRMLPETSEDDPAAGTEPVHAAIDALRSTLAAPRGIARLVGISGMGKTRLAEALFENTVFGEVPALPQQAAVYGDIALGRLASWATDVEKLAASGRRAILIVDNCNDGRHAELAAIVSRQFSGVSLLTIDYSVEGDLVAGTRLVRLGDNSNGTLDALIAQRFPKLSEIQRSKLVEFAGGNARIALAIARGVSEYDTLSALNDDGLLDRLFQDERRGGHDDTVRPAAEASALVYAFHADALPEVAVEHPILAGTVELTPPTFYRAVERMVDFGIAQQRGAQRAIKPDALADRLAEMRLRHEDPTRLLATFSAGSPRLFASFARRLGRLHKSPKAQQIAEAILAPDGWLGDPAQHDARQRYAFAYIAPSAREAALAAIERASGEGDWLQHSRELQTYADTLAHIAWDEELYERAMRAMAPLVVAEAGENRSKFGESRNDSIRRLFLERFRPALSFTKADPATRLDVIDVMLDDQSTEVRNLAIEALDAMLEGTMLSSSFQTDFGTRNQLREWRWKSAEERDDWFDQVYRRLETLVANDGPLASRARTIVATNARGNVSIGAGLRMVDALRAVRPEGYWDLGWREVNEVLHFDRSGLPAELRTAFEQLEREFRPQDSAQAFVAFVLGKPWRHWHSRGDDRRHTRNVGLLARGCGVRLASARELPTYLARATGAEHGQGPSRFGAGLASRAIDLETLWGRATAAFREALPEARGPALLSGILEEAQRRDAGWVAIKIEQIIADPDLASHSVEIIPRGALNAATIDQLIEALNGGRITPDRLMGLMYGGVTTDMDAGDLARLLSHMIDHPNGAVPALGVLHMRAYADRQDKRPVASALMDVARRLVIDTRVYRSDRQHADFEVGYVAKLLLPDESLARQIAQRMVAANQEDHWYTRDFSELKKLIIEHHLLVALDEFVEGAEGGRILDGVFGNAFSDDDSIGESAAQLDLAVVRRWIVDDPQRRAELLAEVIPYAVRDEGGAFAWSPVALAILDLAPDRIRVLDALADRFYSGVSSGPFYLRFVRRLPMIEALLADPDAKVRQWARERRAGLRIAIAHEQKRERAKDSSFEP